MEKTLSMLNVEKCVETESYVDECSGGVNINESETDENNNSLLNDFHQLPECNTLD